MKEFTRVITAQVTQIRQIADVWADDVEVETMKDKKNLVETLKKTFGADDVVADMQLFITDVNKEEQK